MQCIPLDQGYLSGLWGTTHRQENLLKEFQAIGCEQSVYLCHAQLEIGPEKIVDSGRHQADRLK